MTLTSHTPRTVPQQMAPLCPVCSTLLQSSVATFKEHWTWSRKLRLQGCLPSWLCFCTLVSPKTSVTVFTNSQVVWVKRDAIKGLQSHQGPGSQRMTLCQVTSVEEPEHVPLQTEGEGLQVPHPGLTGSEGNFVSYIQPPFLQIKCP